MWIGMIGLEHAARIAHAPAAVGGRQSARRVDGKSGMPACTRCMATAVYHWPVHSPLCVGGGCELDPMPNSAGENAASSNGIGGLRGHVYSAVRRNAGETTKPRGVLSDNDQAAGGQPPGHPGQAEGPPLRWRWTGFCGGLGVPAGLDDQEKFCFKSVTYPLFEPHR